MCNYQPYVLAMVREQFYSHFPRMLRDTAKRYKFGQSYTEMYGTHKGKRTDQSQIICERLCNIIAGTYRFLPRTPRSIPTYLFLAHNCIPIVAHYLDVLKMEDRWNTHPIDMDRMFDTYTRCVSNMLATLANDRPLPKETRIAYVKVDLLAKLENLPAGEFSFRPGLMNACHSVLQADYHSLLEEIYLPRVMQHIRFKTLASNIIKAQGNSLFAEGAHKQALQKYRAALEVDIWNTAAAANAATCLLRQGLPIKALKMAMLGANHQPTWGKGWARIAEAFMAVGDRPSAEQSIAIACDLGPSSSSVFKEVLNMAPTVHKQVPRDLLFQWRQLMNLATARRKVTDLTTRLPQHTTQWVMTAAMFAPLGGVLQEPIWMISLSSTIRADLVDSEACEGIPSPALLEAFIQKNLVDNKEWGGRPTTFLVAHRLAYAWPELRALCRLLGVVPELEVRHDAELSAWRNTTDWLGFNGPDEGRQKYMPKYLPLMCDVERWAVPEKPLGVEQLMRLPV